MLCFFVYVTWCLSISSAAAKILFSKTHNFLQVKRGWLKLCVAHKPDRTKAPLKLENGPFKRNMCNMSERWLTVLGNLSWLIYQLIVCVFIWTFMQLRKVSC